MIMFSEIYHVAIICSDKDKALHFYHDLLGFPMIRSNYRTDRNDWKIDLLVSGELSGPHTELELFIAPSAPKRPSYPEAQGLRHLAFKVASVPDAVAWLRERGIECEHVRQDTYTGESMTFFHDPDGLPVEIHERDASAFR